jgi:type IV secretory pathway TrbD component
MRAFQVAGLALIVALGYIGVSWAAAGVGLCLFATTAWVLVWRASTSAKRRSRPG